MVAQPRRRIKGRPRIQTALLPMTSTTVMDCWMWTDLAVLNGNKEEEEPYSEAPLAYSTSDSATLMDTHGAITENQITIL